MTLNATHDPCLRSWVQSAVIFSFDVPIQSLPLGVFAARAAELDAPLWWNRAGSGAAGHGGFLRQ